MSARYKVLLADDSAEDRQITEFALRDSRHFRITGYVANGDQLIAYFNGWHDFADRRKFPLPEVLLLDLAMPYRDGFEVLRWLKAHPQGVLWPIILTSSDHPEHEARAIALGARGYLVKPVTARELQGLEARLFSVLAKARGAEEKIHAISWLSELTPNTARVGSFL